MLATTVRYLRPSHASPAAGSSTADVLARSSRPPAGTARHRRSARASRATRRDDASTATLRGDGRMSCAPADGQRRRGASADGPCGASASLEATHACPAVVARRAVPTRQWFRQATAQAQAAERWLGREVLPLPGSAARQIAGRRAQRRRGRAAAVPPRLRRSVEATTPSPRSPTAAMSVSIGRRRQPTSAWISARWAVTRRPSRRRCRPPCRSRSSTL